MSVELSQIENLDQMAEAIADAAGPEPLEDPTPTEGEEEALAAIEALSGDETDHRSQMINQDEAEEAVVDLDSVDPDISDSDGQEAAERIANIDWQKVSQRDLDKDARDIMAASSEIQHLYQTGQINQQQYNHAATQLQQLGMANQAAMLQKREADLVIKQQQAQNQAKFNQDIAEFIPGWGQLERRPHIIKQFENYLLNNGATPEYLQRIDGDLDAIKMHWGQYQKAQEQSRARQKRKIQALKKKKAKAKKAAVERQQTNNVMSSDEKAGAIADLLIGEGLG